MTSFVTLLAATSKEGLLKEMEKLRRLNERHDEEDRNVTVKAASDLDKIKYGESQTAVVTVTIETKKND